jgi:hypothetical protein
MCFRSHKMRYVFTADYMDTIPDEPWARKFMHMHMGMHIIISIIAVRLKVLMARLLS